MKEKKTQDNFEKKENSADSKSHSRISETSTSYSVSPKTDDQTVNLVLDTIEINKQALVFNNTKSSAEKCAEDIAKKIKVDIYPDETQKKLKELATEILTALSKPTKQCERLAKCVEKGIAYHHAGLVGKQKELIEDNFRNGLIRIISCTPTLAIGMDLPAFRAIMKSLRRYSQQGLQYIPVLEYMQMSGRAGRPGKEDFGEAIIIAATESEKKLFKEKFINGSPENIYSKLAVEPVLRTYLLSLIVSGIIIDYESTIEFFEKTFWAHQFKDMDRLEFIIESQLEILEEYRFIVIESTTENKDIKKSKLRPTDLGTRVSELYIDPYTANYILECLQKAEKETTDFAYLQMVCFTLEMRPLLKVKTAEFQQYQQESIMRDSELLSRKPTIYDFEFENYFDSLKTTFLLNDWINEYDDEFLMEKYDARPGEVRYKLERADWLLYATEELARIESKKELLTPIKKIRMRLKEGVKEELLTLLQLKNIGRVRARRLYNQGIKDLGDIKKTDFTSLSQILGQAVAKDVKEQVGDEVEQPVKENKRKGQINLNDFQ